MLLLVTLFGHRVPLTWRITGSLAFMTALMVALPLVAPLGERWTLGIMFLIGVTSAVLQPSMVGFTSMLPPMFNQGNMLGQGLSGVASCVANIIVLVALPDAGRTAATVYFAVSAVSLVACLVSYLYILRLPFTRYYMERAGVISGGKPQATPESEEAALMDGGSLPAGKAPVSRMRVLYDVRLMAFTVWLVFTVTFVIFPGVAPFSIAFKNGLGSLHIANSWWSIVLLTTFNTFDTVGRFLPSVVQLLRGPSLTYATILRALTVPAFIGAALSWAPWMGDVYAFLVMCIFSVTNGYFASLAMMHGPGSVPPEQREMAGFVLSLFLQFGIFSGSQLALGVKKLLPG